MYRRIVNDCKLLRPTHYIKNFLIFLPLFFSRQIFTYKFFKAYAGFLAFCLIASAVYIINDLMDVEKDRCHPVKCKRPIASGAVSVQHARLLCGLLIIISFAILFIFRMNITVYGLMLIYMLINIGYSAGFKNYPVIDITLLASGFLIRVLYGGISSDVAISSWLYLTVISFAFYMGLGKRRNELREVSDGNTRTVNKYYTESFLDKQMYMCLALGLVFYSLWTMDQNESLMCTIPIVLVICMKYNHIMEDSAKGDPIPTLLSCKVLITLLLVYIMILFLVIYMR